MKPSAAGVGEHIQDISLAHPRRIGWIQSGKRLVVQPVSLPLFFNCGEIVTHARTIKRLGRVVAGLTRANRSANFTLACYKRKTKFDPSSRPGRRTILGKQGWHLCNQQH